ncbi:MAG: TIGR04133 family radical SAM/SPASM protein [Treponema sp.]|nr:TIGR04133 family radical SAM/SPASM protein [Treponema sp.]
MPGAFSQFVFNRFRRNEARLHDLNYLFWECTLRCNLNCRHCGSDCRSDSGVKDMPFEDFLGAIAPLKTAYPRNSITVAIMGGEPLARADLPLCGKRLRENGFLWGMVTNGFAYTPETHERLLDSGMGSVTLSLDGLEATHNWMRGNDRSFERAARALDLIAGARGLAYDVVTCVNKKNIGELERLKEFLIARKAAAWRIFTVAPIGRAATDADMELSAEELARLMDFISGARREGRIALTFSCEAYLGRYETKARGSRFFCRAGVHIASVLADGSISACPNIDRSFAQGNIYRDDFLQVWNERFQVMRDRRWARTGACADCADFKNCEGGAMHLWNERRDSVLTCIHKRLGEKAGGKRP